MRHDDVTGLILAGGRAQRMDGRDKGLIELHGRPLIAHVLERFAPQVGPLLISANRHRERYAANGHEIVADAIDGYPGPLAGLHAGLLSSATPLLAAVPCDAPLLPSDLVARLAAALEQAAAPVATVSAGGLLQPTFLLCRRTVLADLECYIAKGGRKVRAWLADIGAVTVPFDLPDAFANINTPEELDRMAGLCWRQPG